ncbi:MAG: hypothetical protein WCI73_14085, partial [Phycisphaerae bacterium]
MSFSPGAGSVVGKQGLYVVAAPQSNSPDQYAFEINPVTGATINTSTNSIQDADGNVINVGAADFNSAGQLIVLDRTTGRLLDVDLASGVAGATWSTASGSINATVGALTFDPVKESYLAVDNVTGLLVGPLSGPGTSLLVKINDFTQTNSDAQNLGRFAFDGTVTGRVYVSGSIAQFYAGWLLTGLARNLTNSVSPAAEAGIKGTDLADNFHVGGDIQNLVVLASIGTDGVPSPVLPAMITHFDLTAQGKIGAISTMGTFCGSALAADEMVIPNLNDSTGPVQEVESYAISAKKPLFSFASLVPGNPPTFPERQQFGYLVEPGMSGGATPFSNDTFVTAQYVGSIRNATSGKPDVLHIQGILDAADAGGSKGPDQADYYAVGMLAGQTVDVALTGHGSGIPPVLLMVGVFDPDGRMIASDVHNPGVGVPIRFTADRPGVYRLAVWLAEQIVNAPAINAVPANPKGPTAGYDDVMYDLQVGYDTQLSSGIGDLAIGAIVARNSIIISGTGIKATNGDIGAIVANSANNVTEANLNSVLDLAGTNILNGSLRAMVGGSLGSLANVLKPALCPVVGVLNGGIGLLRATQASGLMQVFATAGKNIQMIDAAGELTGSYVTKQAIGDIRAGKITYGYVSPNVFTQFYANSDNVGTDGNIDLIDVSGDFGSVLYGGPVLGTGIGGNVRFLHVGGQVYQDIFFSTGTSGNIGEITHASGEAAILVDDSGAVLTIAPTKGVAPTPNNPNGLGQLTTLTYGVRGSGGVVIIGVTSTTSLNIDAAPGGSGRSAEIGKITVDSTLAIPIIINAKGI